MSTHVGQSCGTYKNWVVPNDYTSQLLPSLSILLNDSARYFFFNFSSFFLDFSICYKYLPTWFSRFEQLMRNRHCFFSGRVRLRFLWPEERGGVFIGSAPVEKESRWDACCLTFKEESVLSQWLRRACGLPKRGGMLINDSFPAVLRRYFWSLREELFEINFFKRKSRIHQMI